MAEPQIQVQPDPITVTPGGAETAPVSVMPEQGPAEPQVELAPGLQPPEVTDELRDAGVRYSPINPPVSPQAQEAGVRPSIGPSFASSNLSIGEAEKIAKTGDVKTASPWRALLNFIQRLREQKSQNKQPSEAS